jgi:hypothetical protein
MRVFLAHRQAKHSNLPDLRTQPPGMRENYHSSMPGQFRYHSTLENTAGILRII